MKNIWKGLCIFALIFTCGCTDTKNNKKEEKQESKYTQLISEAISLKEKEEYDQAIEKYQEAINEEPTLSDAYIAIADIYANMDDYEKAFSILDVAQLDCNNQAIDEAYSSLKEKAYDYYDLMAITTSSMEMAAFCYEHQIKLFPTKGNAYIELAKIQQVFGCNNEAVHTLEVAKEKVTNTSELEQIEEMLGYYTYEEIQVTNSDYDELMVMLEYITSGDIGIDFGYLTCDDIMHNCILVHEICSYYVTNIDPSVEVTHHDGPDPLNKLVGGYDYYTIPSDVFDSIVLDVFGVYMDHDAYSDTVYYNEEYLYYTVGGFGWWGFNLALVDAQILEDGSIKCIYTVHDEIATEYWGIYEVKARLNLIDSHRIWRIYESSFTQDYDQGYIAGQYHVLYQMRIRTSPMFGDNLVKDAYIEADSYVEIEAVFEDQEGNTWGAISEDQYICIATPDQVYCQR